jgi:two-component system sensor histidine kinase YesM
MKTLRIGKRVSVFGRILLMFLAAVLPLYVLDVRITLKGRNDVRAEIAYAALSKMSFYVSSLDKDFSNILSMESRLINDDDINKLLRTETLSSDYERYFAMNAVRDTLMDLKGRSDYILDAAIYLPSVGKRIAMKSIEDLDQRELERMKGISVLETFPFGVLDGRTYICITPELYSSASVDASSPSFIVCVEISTQRLVDSLADISGSEHGGALLIGRQGGLNAAGPGSERLLPAITDFLRKRADTRDETGVGTMETSDARYIVSYAESELLRSTLVVYILEEKLLGSLSLYKAWLWAASAVTLAIMLLFSLWIRATIAKPLDKLMHAFKAVEAGNLDASVHYAGNDEFGYLYRSYNDMFGRLKDLIHEVYEQRMLVQRAEFKQLQYQINPHFLYNSILIVHSLIRMQDYDCALKMAEHLGSYYRYLTRSSADTVPLEQEIAHARDYLAIQNIRFTNRFTVDFDAIPDGCADMPLPRLIVQPVIENCFSHGFKNMAADAALRVSMRKDARIFTIRVEDNGDGMDEEELEKLRSLLVLDGRDGDRSGLLNVHRRLRIRYGPECGLTVQRGEPRGLRVEIHVAMEEVYGNAPPADR